MSGIRCLTDGQRKLAEENLQVVSRAIHRHIIVSENVFGFEYDDLYQEGCIWLCKAAATFQADKGIPFPHYAEKVVANGLRTYCRLMCGKQQRCCTLPLHAEPDDNLFSLEQIPVSDYQDDIIAETDAIQLLHRMKRQYSGTVRLGIEAIELKVQGYSGAEIAVMYGVKPNLVGAWISRAKSRLKQNDAFKDYFRGSVEKAS